jgi:hypothetical protein
MASGRFSIFRRDAGGDDEEHRDGAAKAEQQAESPETAQSPETPAAAESESTPPPSIPPPSAGESWEPPQPSDPQTEIHRPPQRTEAASQGPPIPVPERTNGERTDLTAQETAERIRVAAETAARKAEERAMDEILALEEDLETAKGEAAGYGPRPRGARAARPRPTPARRPRSR